MRAAQPLPAERDRGRVERDRARLAQESVRHDLGSLGGDGRDERWHVTDRDDDRRRQEAQPVDERAAVHLAAAPRGLDAGRPVCGERDGRVAGRRCDAGVELVDERLDAGGIEREGEREPPTLAEPEASLHAADHARVGRALDGHLDARLRAEQRSCDRRGPVGEAE